MSRIRKIKRTVKELVRLYNEGAFSDLNEADTEDKLIKPFLESLGWKCSSKDVKLQKYIPLKSKAGGKHGIKPDIILAPGEDVQVVIESKRVSIAALSLLEKQSSEQFDATPADIAILTNGLQYWFFSWVSPQSDGSAYMHSEPFAVIDIRYLDIHSRDAFLKYLFREKYDMDMLKWFNAADHIDRGIYHILGKRVTRADKRMGRKVFMFALKKYNYAGLNGANLSGRQVKELYQFTQNHSRWNFACDKYPFNLMK